MPSLLEKIDELKKQGEADLCRLKTEQEAQDLKVKYIGRKGLLTHLLKELSHVDPEVRPQVGQAVNQFKDAFEGALERFFSEKKKKSLEASLSQEKIDITLPGRSIALGHLHPVTQMMEEVQTFFLRFGFDVYEGPEIETDYYNFEALGIPPDHPARDMQDTFYLESTTGRATDQSPLLLRTHTSPVQIHVMEKNPPPIRMIAPGPVYRRDSDVSHTPMFHQVEGLWVDEGISMAHLKGVLKEFLHEIFDPTVKLRFRPSYFPFTEPSAEVDISCVICGARGCRVCKNTGWLEVMGCGMVDPVVFEYVKIDPERYTGFAFGMGIERMAMLKFGIDDIRLFFENDVRFLKQF